MNKLAPKPKPHFRVRLLDRRILLSATWLESAELQTEPIEQSLEQLTFSLSKVQYDLPISVSDAQEPGGNTTNLYQFERIDSRDFEASESLPEQISDADIDGVKTEIASEQQGDTNRAVRRELVIIDTGTPNYASFVEDLRSRTDPQRELEIYFTSHESDGFLQVEDLLAKYENGTFDALHVIAHATDHALKLGATWIDSVSISETKNDFQLWGSKLRDDGDLLLYACDIASREAGRHMLDQIVEWTHADVAASINKFGSIELGGSWTLDYQVGTIETTNIVSPQLQDTWQGLLSAFTVLNTNDSGPGSLRQAILNANALAGSDRISFNIPTTDINYNQDQLGTFVIKLSSALPTITDPVVIDATTQATYTGMPVIELVGDGTAVGTHGFSIHGGNSTIRGLSITGFSGSGIHVENGNGNIIEGNIIGLRPLNYGAQDNAIGGAVGWWRAEMNGLDEAGKNHATLHGDVQFGNGRIGTALQLDGADDFLSTSIPVKPSFTTTIWARSNTPTWSADGWIASSRQANGFSIHPNKDTNTVSFYVNDSLGVPVWVGSTNVADITQWHQYTLSYDSISGQAKVYIDGAIEATTNSFVSRQASTVTVNFGRDNLANQGGSGSIDEAAVFSRVLSDFEVRALFEFGNTGKTPAITSQLVYLQADQSTESKVSTTDATLVNGATYAQGKLEQAFSLDGINDYVTLGIADETKLTGDRLTISAWLKPSTFNGNDTYIVSREGEYQLAISSLGRVWYSLAGTSSGWARTETGYTIAAGTWTYLALSYDGEFTKLYANGVEVFSLATTGQITDVNSGYNETRIGNRELPGQVTFFHGLVDEFQINGRALSASEIAQVYASVMRGPNVGNNIGISISNSSGNIIGGSTTEQRNVISGNSSHGVYLAGSSQQLNRIQGNFIGTSVNGEHSIGNLGFGIFSSSSGNVFGGSNLGEGNTISGNLGGGIALKGYDAPDGLVSWWKAEESQQPGTSDTVGGNEVTLINGATYAPGLSGNAFSFDGVNDYVRVGNPESLQITKEITLSAWIKTEDFSNGQVRSIVGKWGQSVSHDAYTLVLAKSGGAIKVIAAVGDGITGDNGLVGSTIVPGVWTHVAMTYDSSNGSNRLYVNGTEVATRVRPKGIINSPRSFLIGAEDFGPHRFFKGLIDEVAVFNRVLSATEISDTYLARGISLPGSFGNTVQGNRIGTAVNGSTALGNGGPGVYISSTDNLIGGTFDRTNNLIANNLGDGVLISGPFAIGNSILGNTYVSNLGLSINLGSDGATSNDPNDFDNGPNLLQNYPVLSTLTYTENGVIAHYSLDASPGNYRIEFFGSSNTNGLGLADSRLFLGAQTIFHPGSISTYNLTLNDVTIDTEISMTATQVLGSDYGNTSEFSPVSIYTVSGIVFDDLYYQGGAGRNYSTANSSAIASGIPDGAIRRPNAAVELYDSLGNFITSTTTNHKGQYAFGVLPGIYGVRVVNASVTSSYGVSELIGVQTYRTDVSQGYLAPVKDIIGGASPQDVDAIANVTSLSISTLNSAAGIEVQSLTTVKVVNRNFADVDFGFSFNTITNTNDDGQGSLRQFIHNSNLLPGAQHSNFQLQTTDSNYNGGVWTIRPHSALPNITDSIILNGASQSSFTNAPVIQISGELAGNSVDGLKLVEGSENSVIRGFMINRFDGDGIEVMANVIGIHIAGNQIGITASGSTDAGNSGHGVLINGASVTVGGSTTPDRNIISGNSGAGIAIHNSTTGTTILGNYLGLTAMGNNAIANAYAGLAIRDSANTQIGDGTASGANWIAGNGNAGIVVTGSAANQSYDWNYIGFGLSGSVIGSGLCGGFITDMEGKSVNNLNLQNNRIVSNSFATGIYFGNGVLDGIINITGNTLGLSLDGISTLGSLGSGIKVASSITEIKSNLNISDNIIAKMAVAGISIEAAPATPGNVISICSNSIHHIEGAAISIANGNNKVKISQNTFYENKGMGIDLGKDGPNANDGAVLISAANLLTDSPVITSANLIGRNLYVAGYVGSASGQTLFANNTVELYVADTESSDNNGRMYLGSLVTDSSGRFSGTLDLTSKNVLSTDKLTALATDTGFNTSEFALQFDVNVAPTATPDSIVASEAGGTNNSIAGLDTTGNLLTNDSDTDLHDSLTVTGIASGIQSTTNGSIAAPVIGLYGSIIVRANGSYHYMVDNENLSVEALRLSTDSLTDLFSYSISDAAGQTSTALITVKIQGANDSPRGATPASLTVNENAAANTSIGNLLVHDVDDADTFTYSLTDDAGGRFSIDNNTGAVTVASPALLNFEEKSSHVLQVRILDKEGLSRDVSLYVSVIDINEFNIGQVTDLNHEVNSVNENSPVGAMVGITAFANDMDGTNNAISYSLPDNDANLFGIDPLSGMVTVQRAIDREVVGPTSTITIRATSIDGSYSDLSLVIAINDVDEFDIGPLTDINLMPNSVLENATFGTTIPINVRAIDYDATLNTVIYSLLDDDGQRFGIDAKSGAVTVVGAIDRETDGLFRHIVVRAISSDGSISDQMFTITISDINEYDIGPVLDINTQDNYLDENSPVGTSVNITAFSTDADADDFPITYSLSNDDDGKFLVDALTGRITLASALDRETDGPVRFITVRASSTNGAFSEQTFAITINDIDEFDTGPIVDTDTKDNGVNENAAIGSFAGITITATDADATSNVIKYMLIDDDNGHFAIDFLTGAITVASTIDSEELGESRNVIVRALSSDGSFTDKLINIPILDADEFDATPLHDMNLNPNAVDENALFGTSVQIRAFSKDADATNNAIVYSLTDDDEGRFAINSVTGIVTVAGFLDREKDGETREVTIRATSRDKSFVEQVFSISINDLTEFPVGTLTDTNPLPNVVREHSARYTDLNLTAFAIDLDATLNTVSYKLLDNAQGRFMIDTMTGKVSVADSALIRYELAPSYTIIVEATSSDGSTQAASFQITVENVNDAPFAVDDHSTISENGLHELSVVTNDYDFDPNDELKLVDAVLVSGQGSISFSEDLIYYSTGTAYDYLSVAETATAGIRYTISDSFGLHSTAFMTLTITGARDSLYLNAPQVNSLEDAMIIWSIAVQPVDQNGEVLSSVFISGLPVGTWLTDKIGNRIFISNFGLTEIMNLDLDRIEVVLPHNLSGSFPVMVTTESNLGSMSIQSITRSFNIAPSADTPILSVQSVRGQLGEEIPLDIDAQLTDLDGSEKLEIKLRGLSKGITLTDGVFSQTVVDSKSWLDISSWNLQSVLLQTDGCIDGVSTLEIRVLAREQSGNAVSQVNRTIFVTIDQVLPQSDSVDSEPKPEIDEIETTESKPQAGFSFFDPAHDEPRPHFIDLPPELFRIELEDSSILRQDGTAQNFDRSDAATSGVAVPNFLHSRPTTIDAEAYNRSMTYKGELKSDVSPDIFTRESHTTESFEAAQTQSQLNSFLGNVTNTMQLAWNVMRSSISNLLIYNERLTNEERASQSVLDRDTEKSKNRGQNG